MSVVYSYVGANASFILLEDTGREIYIAPRP